MLGSPSGSGVGLIRVPVAGGKCEWVSRHYQDGTGDVGPGATINTLNPEVFSSSLERGLFYGSTGPNPSGNTLP